MTQRDRDQKGSGARSDSCRTAKAPLGQAERLPGYYCCLTLRPVGLTVGGHLKRLRLSSEARRGAFQ
jgi:hypothetical protein